MVTGTVTDNQDRPIENAAVRLENRANLRVRSARTNRKGKYFFHSLNPQADYKLRASFQGRSSDWADLSRFDEGEKTVVDLKIK